MLGAGAGGSDRGSGSCSDRGSEGGRVAGAVVVVGKRDVVIWEFPKIRGTLYWGPYRKGSYYLGYYIRVPIFGNSHIIMQHSN